MVHQWQVRLMNRLIRVWFINLSQLPNSQYGAYSQHWYLYINAVALWIVFCKYCSHIPPFAATVPPTESPQILISAVPYDIRNSVVNTFRWNQQTSETSVIERVWGDPHQDKSHR